MAQRRRKEAELREELEFHLEEEAAETEAAGMTTESSKYAARRELGNVALVMEDTRAAWGWICLERLWPDLRYSPAHVAQEPGVRRRRHSFAGAGDRRQYGDFQPPECRRAQAPARARSARAGASSTTRFHCGKPAAPGEVACTLTRSSNVFRRNRRPCPRSSADTGLGRINVG